MSKKLKKQLIISMVISFSFLSIGIALLYYELIGYGLSLFAFLPFILGFILGRSVIRLISLAGLAISLAIFFALLIAGELEGMVCILMALPLVIGAILLGVLVRFLLNRYRKGNDPDDVLPSSILPFCLFLLFGIAEKKLTTDNNQVVSVTTERILPYSCLQVYETIKSVDTLTGEKPILMKLDLPVPMKCVLEKEEVGGLRTCYFSGGIIRERITELEKGKILRMDVIDSKLPIRRWLEFKEAIYYFDQVGNESCKITRITTYTSELLPRFYWESFEKLGISEEHEYVFNNLENDLRNTSGN